MNNSFQEASEVGEIRFEGLTSPGTTFTSPWLETDRSSDTGFVNTVTQTALPGVNTKGYPEPTFISALTQIMSPTGKVDAWFTSTPAGPSQSSTSRPNTRDTALTSLAGDQSQLSNQNTGDAFIDPSATGPRTRNLFLDSLLEDHSQLPAAQMDARNRINSSVTASQATPPNTRLGARDPFFDSVPKGPSQLSTSRWNARAPAFTPWQYNRDQAPASPCNKTEASVSPTEIVEYNARPRLTLRIPNTTRGSDNFRSAPQMATHSEVLGLRADHPHTTDSLVPAPSLQGPQRQTSRREEMLNAEARPFQPKFSGLRAARRTSHTLMQPLAASHTNSKTWTSNLIMEKERWQRVEDSLRGMHLLRSSVVPKTLKDWLAHQRARADATREREQRKLDDMNRSLRDPRLPPPNRPVKIGPAFRGRAFEHKNYGSVLVFPTVWARMYEPPAERLDPLWPCAEEMKEEGDERHTSNYRRFPALPRVPGNNTVQYKLKAIQPFLQFDAVWKLPTRKSVEAANEQYSADETEKMEGYLGRSLLDALDCTTEDNF